MDCDTLRDDPALGHVSKFTTQRRQSLKRSLAAVRLRPREGTNKIPDRQLEAAFTLVVAGPATSATRLGAT
jgi:hypothetical protein